MAVAASVWLIIFTADFSPTAETVTTLPPPPAGLGLLVRADLGRGAMGNWIGGAAVELPGLGATVRNSMGPVAPPGDLRTLVGEFGAKASLPPEVVVRLLGLTMRTMEGPPPTPPFPETGIAWPLLDSKIILLPVPDTAVAPGGPEAVAAPPAPAVALEVGEAELEVTTTEAACDPGAALLPAPGAGALM